MTDMNRIHKFAVKWCNKFRDGNTDYTELVDRCMADDCAALGFEMDCGHAFTEKYGDAASNSEALDRIIDEADDIPLLGSAIYSQWRYFNHWAYSGAEILEPQNRAWFITALSRLETLSSTHGGSACTIILFPELAALKKEAEKLRAEIAALLVERDELRLVVCKSIETAYMLSLGSLEYRAFALKCKVLRLKRKIDLIREKKNRQEKIVLSVIEETLDAEFAEFQRQLDEQINKMNRALDHSKVRPLTHEGTKEIRKMCRNIVKALHPDLHPDITPAHIQLFHNAVQAYENGDLNTLRIISEMAAEPAAPGQSENGLAALVKEKKRLTKTLELIREQISVIKAGYPYTVKDLVEDPELIAEKKAELEETIAKLKKAYAIYAAQLKEILR